MAHIGVAVLEQAAAVGESAEDMFGHHDGADRLIAGAQPLGEGQEIGHDFVLLAGKHGAGPAHAAHHLVEDQQDAVAVADLADPLEIARRRRHRAGGCAHHSFGDEGRDRVGAEFEDLVLELVCDPQPVDLRRLLAPAPAILVAGLDAVGLDQQRLEIGAAPAVAAGGQRAQRVAVEALAPGDEFAAPGLAALDEILACHLQSRFDGLGTAADEECPVERAGRPLGEFCGQAFNRIVGEIAGVGEGDLFQLIGNGLLHPAIGVPQTGDRRAAAAVEIFPPGGVVDIDAVAMGHRRHGARERAVENMAHRVIVRLGRRAISGAESIG